MNMHIVVIFTKASIFSMFSWCSESSTCYVILYKHQQKTVGTNQVIEEPVVVFGFLLDELLCNLHTHYFFFLL